jgi:hypothetical protein
LCVDEQPAHLVVRERPRAFSSEDGELVTGLVYGAVSV